MPLILILDSLLDQCAEVFPILIVENAMSTKLLVALSMRDRPARLVQPRVNALRHTNELGFLLPNQTAFSIECRFPEASVISNTPKSIPALHSYGVGDAALWVCRFAACQSHCSHRATLATSIYS